MLTSIPVDPDADTARQWAIDELSKSEYAQDGESWLESFWRWLNDLFSNIGDAGSGLSWPGVVVFIVLGAALVALVVWIVVGPLRRSRHGIAADDIFDGDQRQASELRAEAQAAANAADWTTALVLMFRCIVRTLDERGTIAIEAGMTAHEASVAAGVALPDIAGAIGTDADRFDGARYGRLVPTEQHYLHAVATYDAIRQASRRSVATS
jgi:hypothetical protein